MLLKKKTYVPNWVRAVQHGLSEIKNDPFHNESLPFI